MILIINEANVQTKKSNTIQFRCKDAENANQRTEKHSTCGMSRRGAATRCGAKHFVCGEYIKIQVFGNVVGVCLLENGDIQLHSRVGGGCVHGTLSMRDSALMVHASWEGCGSGRWPISGIHTCNNTSPLLRILFFDRT
jgi:hypothetical protein